MTENLVNNKIFCFLFNNEQQNFIAHDKDIIDKYLKLIPAKTLYLINVQNFIFESSKINKINKINNNKTVYLKPKNLRQLRNFCKNKKLIIFGLRLFKIEYLYLEILLKYFGCSRILINDAGYFPISIKKKSKLLDQLKFLISYKIRYITFRILSIINLICKFDLCFESSESRIKQIQNSLSYKIDHFFKINIFSYYKKIIRINSHLKAKKIKSKKLKYIVFCDDGFDHPDRTIREFVKKNDRELYYKRLYFFLKKLENTFQKKIIFCKHPRAKYPFSRSFLRIKNSFLVKIGTSEKDILSSFLFLINSTSMISKAILFKKKVIVLKSSLLGYFINLRINEMINEIKLPVINIDDYNVIDIKKKILNINKKHIKNFIFKNIFLKSKKTNAVIIKNYISRLKV